MASAGRGRRAPRPVAGRRPPRCLGPARAGRRHAAGGVVLRPGHWRGNRTRLTTLEVVAHRRANQQEVMPGVEPGPWREPPSSPGQRSSGRRGMGGGNGQTRPPTTGGAFGTPACERMRFHDRFVGPGLDVSPGEILLVRWWRATAGVSRWRASRRTGGLAARGPRGATHDPGAADRSACTASGYRGTPAVDRRRALRRGESKEARSFRSRASACRAWTARA